MIKYDLNINQIDAGGLGSINIAEANMTAHHANSDDAIALTAALDCGRAESVRYSYHINHNRI